MASDSTACPSAVEVRASLVGIGKQLARLEKELRSLELGMKEAIESVPAEQRESATNLVHYVALRQHDLRDLQQALAQLGLSSLGRSESCVLGALLEVAARAHESLALTDADAHAELSRLLKAREGAMSWEAARNHLHRHTCDMFGPRPTDRHIYVMVTVPSAQEADRAWVVGLLRAGMNVVRINCAHESEAEWAQVVNAVEQARMETGLPCRIIMDLAGPKIRTGAIKCERRIATWRPARDDIGRPTAPARVVLGRASSANRGGERPALFVSDKEFEELRQGDELRFHDTRGKKRTLTIDEVKPDWLVASAEDRSYLLDSVRAQLHRGKKHKDDVSLEVAEPTDAAIDVRMGDTLVLTARDCLGSPPTRDRDGGVETPGVISCTLPTALAHLKLGERVLFDDGRIHAVVERIEEGSSNFVLRVVRTQKQFAKLRGEKGINLPDTQITISGFTEEDRSALSFVAKHADAVSLSFVRTAEDVRALHEELDRLGRANIGIILKIETRAGFENLPRLLLGGLRRPPLAVMIARGDLAVEVGFERLAELQEEMLWLCEASHVPAIWATQVLDTLARTGVPSRAEVTDAAESVAAECVMLNKGPHVKEAVSVLVDILRRMEQHRYKKRSLFRKLHVSSFTAR